MVTEMNLKSEHHDVNDIHICTEDFNIAGRDPGTDTPLFQMMALSVSSMHITSVSAEILSIPSSAKRLLYLLRS